jgi:hypothetical protein
MLGHEKEWSNMKIIHQAEYDKWIKAQNGDSYGLACFRYAEAWANLMEKQINETKRPSIVSEIAESTSVEADTEGITGFMYGVAVKILFDHWEYGDELRIWHNEKYNYKGEGVVNPAVLTIG